MPEFQRGNDAGPTLVVTQGPHFPTMHTRETAQYLAAFGLDENQIAVILRCTPDDVRKHYAEECEHGLARINARVMSAVVHNALYNNDMAAARLWLINKAGWKSGDGARQAMQLNLNPDGTSAGTGEYTVVQRREVITKLLLASTQAKRQQERVIEHDVTPAKPNGTNGKSNGKTNGNGEHK